MSSDAFLTVDERFIVAKHFPKMRFSDRFFNPYVKSGMNAFGVSYAPRRRVEVRVDADSIRHIRFDRGWRRMFVLPVFDESIEIGVADGSRITFCRSQEVHFCEYKLALARFAERNGVEVFEGDSEVEASDAVRLCEDALQKQKRWLRLRAWLLVTVAVWLAAVLGWLIAETGFVAELMAASFEPSLRLLWLPFAMLVMVVSRIAALPLWQILTLVPPLGALIWLGVKK